MIDAGKWPLSVATEQIERPPAKLCRACGPSAIEKTAAVINEAQPTPGRHITRWPIRIEPGKALGPCAERPTIILNYASAFFVGVRPGTSCRFIFLNPPPT